MTTEPRRATLATAGHSNPSSGSKPGSSGDKFVSGFHQQSRQKEFPHTRFFPKIVLNFLAFAWPQLVRQSLPKTKIDVEEEQKKQNKTSSVVLNMSLNAQDKTQHKTTQRATNLKNFFSDKWDLTCDWKKKRFREGTFGHQGGDIENERWKTLQQADIINVIPADKETTQAIEIGGSFKKRIKRWE